MTWTGAVVFEVRCSLLPGSQGLQDRPTLGQRRQHHPHIGRSQALGCAQQGRLDGLVRCRTPGSRVVQLFHLDRDTHLGAIDEVLDHLIRIDGADDEIGGSRQYEAGIS